MAGKAARACDNCLHKRALWYCAADDAFLCQTCDASVHSANQLARRHERVRLHAAESCKSDSNSAPAWHHGFTRKARSPRNVKRTAAHPPPPPPPSKYDDKFPTPPPLVPEIGSEETSPDENDEQFLYRVPTFDPFLDEFGMEYDSKPLHEEIGDLDSLSGFLPSDMDLAEFAADVESYLGAGLVDDVDACLGDKKVKQEQVETEANLQFPRSWSLNHESIVTGEEELEEHEEKRRKISLSLNYEDVINTWASQGSPWTTGNRPEFDLNDYYWLDYMGTRSTNFHGACGDTGGVVVAGRNCGGKDGDGGREARVLRYREKRRTRLFSKKIRYEVRKLNAEKRPRMKGRFVKRASIVAGPRFSLLQR